MTKKIGFILPIEFKKGRGKDKKKRKRSRPLTHIAADKAEDTLIKAYNNKFTKRLSRNRVRKERRRDLVGTALGATTAGTVAALMNKRAGRHPLSGALWSGISGAFLGSQVANIRKWY